MEAHADTLVVLGASQSSVQQRVQAILTVVSHIVQVPWVEVYVPQPNWQWHVSAVPTATQAVVARLRAQVLAAAQTVILNDVPQWTALRHHELVTVVHTHPIQFYGGFPIGPPPYFFGVLSIAAEMSVTLTPQQEQAITVLAEQIGDLLASATLAIPETTERLSKAIAQPSSVTDIYQSVMRLSRGLQRCLSFEDLNNQLIQHLPQELPLQAFELTAHPQARMTQQICLWPTDTVKVPRNDELVCQPPLASDDDLAHELPHFNRVELAINADNSRSHRPGDMSLWRCYQLKVQNRNVGTLKMCLQPAAESQFPENSEILNNLADQIGATLHRLMLLSKLQAENLQDPLTRLFNRRHMMGVLGKLMQRVSYGHYQVGFILLDLDHFKQLNDTYGHDAGDQVLRTMGVFLKGHARPNDVVCRFGGEEFALILPGLTGDILARRAGQLCRGMHYLNCKAGERTLHITLSAGYAIAPLHANTPSSLIKAADEALYEAKRQGRDRVVGASRPAEPDSAPSNII